MKKILLPVLIAIFAFNIAYAENNNLEAKQRIKNKLENFSKEDFKENARFLNKRGGNPEVSEFIKNNSQKMMKMPENQPLSNNFVNQMPDDFVIPGEFEELQAVLIAWPYWSFDAEEKIQQPLEQFFEGKALYFDNITQTPKLIDIVNFADVYEDSPYSFLASQLAYEIQKEVPVWINIWHADDSTEVLDFMTAIGKPLTNYKFIVSPGNSFWYRDCGPVACYIGENDELGFIDFEYYGGRPLDDDLPKVVGEMMGIPVFSNTIEFEGGNILLDGDGRLFTTTAVSYLNADTEGKYYLDETSPYGFSVVEKTPIDLAQLTDSLTRIMNLKSARVLPMLENDGGTGHIDLYADFFDENTFVFTRMPSQLANFKDYKTATKNIDTLLSLNSKAGKPYLHRNIPFPRKDNGNWYSSRKDYANYTRTYSNHILVNKTIIQPVFYDETSGDRVGNEEAIEEIKKAYPGYKIAPIDVRAFDGSGGAIHCITKQIPAENPLRIFHYPVQLSDYDEAKNAYKIDAEIKNRSGIESADVSWRKKGDNNWNKIDLNLIQNDNFTAYFSSENLNEEDEIEYFITAKSNNGKTISKPITAPDGFYTFALKQVSVDGISNQLESSEFFPNPANEFSSIELNIENTSKINIKIMNINGSVVYQNRVDIVGSYDVLTINTSLLESGAYFVTIETDEGTTLVRRLNVVR